MKKGIFQKKPSVTKQELDLGIATEKMINAFQLLLDKKAIEIKEGAIHLYPELWGIDQRNAKAWMENAYMYCRLKLKYPKGIKLDFFDIESGTPLGHWNGKSAEH